MKRIDNLQDLEAHGIEALTGESDAFSYRILCDVTARGNRIIERTLDNKLTLSENWNSGIKDVKWSPKSRQKTCFSKLFLAPAKFLFSSVGSSRTRVSAANPRSAAPHTRRGPDLNPSERLPRLSLLQCTRTPEYSTPFPGEGVRCCRTSGT